MEEYQFKLETETHLGELHAGDVCKINTGELIQILWMRSGSEYPIYTTGGKFLRVKNIHAIISRQFT
jgi:hypothetical protein